jgi:hypothetical protein
MVALDEAVLLCDTKRHSAGLLGMLRACGPLLQAYIDSRHGEHGAQTAPDLTTAKALMRLDADVLCNMRQLLHGSVRYIG